MMIDGMNDLFSTSEKWGGYFSWTILYNDKIKYMSELWTLLICIQMQGRNHRYQVIFPMIFPNDWSERVVTSSIKEESVTIYIFILF